MRVGSTFSGYGGLDMAVCEFFGGKTAWVSEIEPAACKVLAQRMPHAENLGDISKVDWADVEPVDILTGGFPCQDVSGAGKRAGLKAGTRSGLWAELLNATDKLRPKLLIAENVRGLLSARTDDSREVVTIGPKGGRKVGHTDRALGRVLADLADIGYDAQWLGIRAADAGAPHGRFRVFILAHPTGEHRGQWGLAAPEQEAGGESLGQLAGRDRMGTAPNAFGGELQRRGEPGVLGATSPAEPGEGDQRERAGHTARHSGAVTPDSTSDRWDQGWPEPTRLVGGSDAAISSAGAWGRYATAIHHWERALGRSAPDPTELAPRGGRRLAPRFVEWMMGLPAGWVTDVPGITRNEQLRILGNGVVPQQARLALELMLG